MKKRFTVSTVVLSALLIGGLAIALAGAYQQNLERKQQELTMEAMALEARATALDDEWRNQKMITPDQIESLADKLYGAASEYGAAEDVKYAEEFRDAVNSAFVTTTNQTPASKQMIRFNKVWNITSSASLETIL